MKTNLYLKYFKNILDILAGILLLVFTLPLILFCIIILFLFNERKVFFFQKRPGLLEKPFTIIKFKTMNDKRDKYGKLLSDDKRITRIGKIIRKLSIDELLQLINIIKGDMSFIGPRPLLMEYLSLYNGLQKKRHYVKPGITGWAQVNGRNTISWEKKFEYDIWYVENVSFKLDIKIVLLTIKKIIKREDINASEKQTMEKFTGSINNK